MLTGLKGGVQGKQEMEVKEVDGINWQIAESTSNQGTTWRRRSWQREEVANLAVVVGCDAIGPCQDVTCQGPATTLHQSSFSYDAN